MLGRASSSLPSHHHISRRCPYGPERLRTAVVLTREYPLISLLPTLTSLLDITRRCANPTHGVKRLLGPSLYPGTDDGGKEPQFDYTDGAPVEGKGAGCDNGGRGGARTELCFRWISSGSGIYDV